MVAELRNTFTKQPYEQLPIELNFGSLTILPRGASFIAEASATAKKWRRMDPDNKIDATNEFLVLQDGVPKVSILNPSRCKIRLYVKDGESGWDYQVSVRIRFDNEAKLEEELFVRVTER